MSTLIAIGGAINLKAPRLLEEFCQRAGGPAARIVILPTASSQADTGAFYCQQFAALGITTPPTALEIHDRAAALSPAGLEALRDATGIFIAGGNQVRLSAILGGTPVEKELLAAFGRGAILAGTSAGAAILSKVMLAFGKNGPTPRQGIAQFLPGLGFNDQLIFDQHFRQRDRLGRLLFAVACHPGMLGVGVDENTAAIVEGDRLLVCGANAVTIVDGRAIYASNVAELTGRQPAALSGAQVHVLTHGCSFDLCTRQAHIPVSLRPLD